MNFNLYELKLTRRINKTLHQQTCREISVFPQHHLMLLMLQIEEIQILPQKRHRDAAERKLGASQHVVLTCISP